MDDDLWMIEATPLLVVNCQRSTVNSQQPLHVVVIVIVIVFVQPSVVRSSAA